MGYDTSPAILPFAASAALPLPIEVQRFEHGHFVNSAGLHGHGFNEVMLFESSGDIHRVGKRETLTSIGTLDAIGDGQVHEVELSQHAGGWMLLFSDRAIERTRLSIDVIHWFSRRGDENEGGCTLSARRRKRLALYLSTLESNQHVVLRDQQTVTLALFSEILRDLKMGHDLQTPGGVAFRHFERLLDTIEERYDQQLSLEELADAVGLSKAYLTTELRQKTGRSAMQWLLDRRMREARRRLIESNVEITQLAHELGFEDSSYFARRFRATHDMSPASGREARQGVKTRNFVPARRGEETYADGESKPYR